MGFDRSIMLYVYVYDMYELYVEYVLLNGICSFYDIDFLNPMLTKNRFFGNG